MSIQSYSIARIWKRTKEGIEENFFKETQQIYESDISYLDLNGSHSSLSAMIRDSNINNAVGLQNALQKVFENPHVIARFTTQFAVQCSNLIHTSLKATNKKVEAIELTTIDNTSTGRIVALECIWMGALQNLVVLGIFDQTSASS